MALNESLVVLVFLASGRPAESAQRSAASKSQNRSRRNRLEALSPDDVALRHPEHRVVMRLTLSIPPTGFESPAVQRLAVGFGREMAPIKIGLALFRQTEAERRTEGEESR